MCSFQIYSLPEKEMRQGFNLLLTGQMKLVHFISYFIINTFCHKCKAQDVENAWLNLH